VDHAGDIIQRTDGHASDMKALAPDSPLLNEHNVFSCTGKPDRCNPACRASPENSYLRHFVEDYHASGFLIKVFENFSVIYRLFASFHDLSKIFRPLHPLVLKEVHR
jgi:hypothetical protein